MQWNSGLLVHACTSKTSTIVARGHWSDILAQIMEVIRHAGVDSRMIPFGWSSTPTNDLSLQCNVSLITGTTLMNTMACGQIYTPEVICSCAWLSKRNHPTVLHKHWCSVRCTVYKTPTTHVYCPILHCLQHMDHILRGWIKYNCYTIQHT